MVRLMLGIVAVQPRGPQPTTPPSGVSLATVVIGTLVIVSAILAGALLVTPRWRRRTMVATIERWLRQQS